VEGFIVEIQARQATSVVSNKLRVGGLDTNGSSKRVACVKAPIVSNVHYGKWYLAL
jgi:hypothetical protein